MLEPPLLRYNLIRFGDANIAKKPLIPNFLLFNIRIILTFHTNYMNFSNKKKEENSLLFSIYNKIISVYQRNVRLERNQQPFQQQNQLA